MTDDRPTERQPSAAERRAELDALVLARADGRISLDEFRARLDDLRSHAA